MRRSWLFLCFCALIGGCAADPADDAFARRIIDRMQSGDSSLVADLQPNSIVSASGGAGVLRMRESLPRDPIDTLRLLSWTRERDAEGPFRTLTYSLEAQSDTVHVKVFLIREGSRIWLNTLLVSDALPP